MPLFQETDSLNRLIKNNFYLLNTTAESSRIVTRKDAKHGENKL